MTELVVYSTPADGYISSLDTVYSNARAGTGFFFSADDTAEFMQLGQEPANPLCHEGFLDFDTSAIPDEATIDSVVLHLFGHTDNSTQDFTLEVRLHDWGAALTTSDWVAGDDLGSKTLLATLASSGFAVEAYNAFTDVAFPANIDTTGTTRVLICSDRHRIGNAPASGEAVIVYSADEADSSKHPKLVINYSEGVEVEEPEAPGIPDELWIADPDDPNYPDAPTTALVDLNPVGCNPSGVYGFVLMDAPSPALGAPRRSLSLASLIRDGSRQAGQSHDNAPLTYRLGFKGDPDSDFSQIVAAARELSEALLAGGVLAWQVPGMTEPLFYDFEPSGVPNHFHGQTGGLYRLARKLLDVDGLEVVFDAYPWPRLPEATDTGDVSNNTLAQHTTVVSTGNVSGEARHRIAPDGDFMGWLAVGIKARGNISEWATWYARDASTWVLHTDADPVVDTEAMNDEAVEVDFADAEFNAWRFRDPRTVTDPTAVEGKHRVWVRARAAGSGERSLFRVQPRLGFATTDLVQKVGQRWPMDWRNVPVGQLEYIWFDCGLVSIPAGVGVTNIDIWAERLEGEQSLRFDQVVLMPADEYEAVGAVPGFRMGRWGKQEWNAEELDGTGVLRDGTYRLNADGEKAFTPDVLLPAGVHAAKFRGVMREPKDPTITEGPNPTSNVLGKVSVIATDSMAVETVRAVMNIRNHKNRQQDRRVKELQFEVTGADVADGTVFRVEVEQTADTLEGRAIRVIELEASMVPTVPEGDVIVLHNDVRANKGRAYVESSSVSVFSFPLENELLWQPKGTAGYVWLLGDIPQHEGYGEIDDRGPVALAVRDRAAEIASAHTDRVTQ